MFSRLAVFMYAWIGGEGSFTLRSISELGKKKTNMRKFQKNVGRLLSRGRAINTGGLIPNADRLLKDFDALRLRPPHQPVEVKLNEKLFRAQEGAMFYYQFREIFCDLVYDFRCERGDVHIVDCGSNCGLSLLFFKELFPEATITAVEADPAIFNLLIENVRNQGLEDIVFLQKAVTDRSGQFTFYSEGTAMGRLENPHENKDETISVNGVRLDELITGPVDLLKIDIEGAESSAVLACSKLDLVDRMVIEYHSFSRQQQCLPELLAYIRQSGFRFYIKQVMSMKTPFVCRPLYEDMDLQLNLYCLRDTTYLGR